MNSEMNTMYLTDYPILISNFHLRKKVLPSDYRDLPHNLAIKFPVLNEIENIKEAVNLLRNNHYIVYRIPNDWIQKKGPLPPPHWHAENNGLTLPITDQYQVKDLNYGTPKTLYSQIAS